MAHIIVAACTLGCCWVAPSQLPCTHCCCSDPSKLEALNLNPGVPRLNEETRRDFEQFKAEQAASKR